MEVWCLQNFIFVLVAKLRDLFDNRVMYSEREDEEKVIYEWFCTYLEECHNGKCCELAIIIINSITII